MYAIHFSLGQFLCKYFEFLEPTFNHLKNMKEIRVSLTKSKLRIFQNIYSSGKGSCPSACVVLVLLSMRSFRFQQLLHIYDTALLESLSHSLVYKSTSYLQCEKFCILKTLHYEKR